MRDACLYNPESNVAETTISIMFAAFREYVNQDWSAFPFNQQLLQHGYILGNHRHKGDKAWLGLSLKDPQPSRAEASNSSGP